MHVLSERCYSFHCSCTVLVHLGSYCGDFRYFSSDVDHVLLKQFLLISYFLSMGRLISVLLHLLVGNIQHRLQLVLNSTKEFVMKRDVPTKLHRLTNRCKIPFSTCKVYKYSLNNMLFDIILLSFKPSVSESSHAHHLCLLHRPDHS